ncbi:MAG: tyrosine-type recombinase/integrase [Deltaproteobacteria bacterium]|nr:tyrosine-type recombinase/integrase [Deltaproteobacteria bacterium]
MKKRKHLRYESSINKWVVDYGGRLTRSRKYFGARNDAERFMQSDEFLVAVEHKTAPALNPDTPSSISIEEAVKWYGENVSTMKSPFSSKWEPRKLKIWSLKHPGKKLYEIGLRELLEDRAELVRVKKYQPQTANRWLTLIKSFFKSCHQAGLINENPTLQIKKLPVPEAPHVEIVSEADQKKVLLAAKPWVRDPLWLAMQTGTRRNEIVNLRWGSVHLKDGYFIIEMSEGFRTKTRKSRQIPLTPAMAVMFTRLLREARSRDRAKPNDCVFVTATGRRILPDRLTREARKLLKRVLNKKQGAVHIWRHSALTLMLRKGADIETVRRLAGHSSLNITQRYVHSNDVTMLDAMKKLRITPKTGGNVAIGGDQNQISASNRSS